MPVPIITQKEESGNVVLYCRVSSERQEERQTIQAQVEYAEKYCDLHQIRLAAVYKDDGVTGTIPLDARPAGCSLLAAARSGAVQTVLVYKLDRLGRNTRVILNAVSDLDVLGAKVKSMTEPFDTADASGRFLLTILAGVADLERSNILDRMTIGKDRVARSGKWTGGIIPYGYKKDENGFLSVNNERPPSGGMSEKEVIEFIFHHIGEEKETCQQVADKLNALGVPTFYNKKLSDKRRANIRTNWNVGRIARLCHMKTYYGVHEYGKHSKRKDREIITRAVPPIVSKGLWDLVQNNLRANFKNATRGGKKHRFLLAGLIVCGDCGHHFRGVMSRKYGYYSCYGRADWRAEGKPAPCGSMSVRKEWLDSLVWEDCLKYIHAPQLIEEEVKDKTQKDNQREKEIQQIKKQLHACAAEKEKLISLYCADLITMNDVSARLDETKQRYLKLQQDLTILEQKQEPAIKKEQLATIGNALSRLRAAADSSELELETQRSIVHAMIDHVTITTIEHKKSCSVTIYHTFSAYDLAPTVCINTRTLEHDDNNTNSITFSTSFVYRISA